MELKTGVGDKVAEGVKVGVEGVNVKIGVAESTTATGTPAAAVCVAPEIIVDMTAVCSKLRSCVGAGKPGVAQATKTSKRTVTDIRMGDGFRIVRLLSVIQATEAQKRGIIRLLNIRLIWGICSQLFASTSLLSLSRPFLYLNECYSKSVDLKSAPAYFCIMSITEKFGKRVREIRQLRGISQEELSIKSQLHRTYISSLELGKRNVSLLNIEKLAKALGCSIPDFFDENDSQYGRK